MADSSSNASPEPPTKANVEAVESEGQTTLEQKVNVEGHVEDKTSDQTDAAASASATTSHSTAPNTALSTEQKAQVPENPPSSLDPVKSGDVKTDEGRTTSDSAVTKQLESAGVERVAAKSEAQVETLSPNSPKEHGTTGSQDAAAKDGNDDAKHKKAEAGPAARLSDILNKNRSREDLENENSSLRKELTSLRKKLTESLEESEACRKAVTAVAAYAKQHLTAEQAAEMSAKIALLSVKDRKTKKDDYNSEALLGVAGARSSRRRQGRKKKPGKRSHSETEVRRSGSRGDAYSEASSEDPVGRDSDSVPKRMGRQGRRRQPQDVSTAGQQFPKAPFTGPRGTRRRDGPPLEDRRRMKGHLQGGDKAMWLPKDTSYNRKYDEGRHSWENRGKSNASPGNTTEDPENEVIRASLRNATSTDQLQEAIGKAEAKNMHYEAQLGNRKLQRMKAA